MSSAPLLRVLFMLVWMRMLFARFIDLNIEAVGQQVLERGAVKACCAADERPPGRVESEFVVFQGVDRVLPVGIGRAIILEP